MWKCPRCNSEDLTVCISTVAKLTQHAEDDFDTDVVGDHEWGDESHMTCRDCGYASPSKAFFVPEDSVESLLKPVRDYNNRLNAEERVPTGDDYNAVLSLLHLQ